MAAEMRRPFLLSTHGLRQASQFVDTLFYIGGDKPREILKVELSDDIADITQGAVEGSGMLQFLRAHGRGKFSGFQGSHSLHAAVEIATSVGVSAPRCVY